MAETVARTSTIEGGGVEGLTVSSVQNLTAVTKKMTSVLRMDRWLRTAS
jgi:hypothetical protein